MMLVAMYISVIDSSQYWRFAPLLCKLLLSPNSRSRLVYHRQEIGLELPKCSMYHAVINVISYLQYSATADYHSCCQCDRLTRLPLYHFFNRSGYLYPVYMYVG